MIESWVAWTLLAATMQSVRTAGQKALNQDVSALAATLARYLFGLPFALIYLALLWNDRPFVVIEPGLHFFMPAVAACALQIVATILMVNLFTLRNFAVGSTYIRSEILMTALIGVVAFGELISGLGWCAILLSSLGLVLVSLPAGKRLGSLWNRAAAYGLAAGLAFSLCSLFIRYASLSLGLSDPVLAAAFTLAFMVTVQMLMSLAWVCLRDARELVTLFRKWRVGLFIGITSVLGSAGWFTAFTLENAAYVKTLGQVEFLVMLTISVFYFKERPGLNEWLGMLLLVTGVVLLLVVH
ncbi:MAG: EamA family transporter [Proteobacteria bacterium]|jgi:drug/metabolite transporter (DMT)-like permease|nr:EamA family transporter [Pseudomonadota bacterium]MDA1298732.1 EamA family transporter [Pseudomonadota bacterium]